MNGRTPGGITWPGGGSGGGGTARSSGMGGGRPGDRHTSRPTAGRSSIRPPPCQPPSHRRRRRRDGAAWSDGPAAGGGRAALFGPRHADRPSSASRGPAAVRRLCRHSPSLPVSAVAAAPSGHHSRRRRPLRVRRPHMRAMQRAGAHRTAGPAAPLNGNKVLQPVRAAWQGDGQA